MIPDTPSSAASGMGEYELASASVQPEPTEVDTAALIEELRTIAQYACWDKFEDRFTSDPKKHPAWRAADALSAKDRELAEARAENEALRGAVRSGSALRKTVSAIADDAQAKLEECAPYLKDGETPCERIQREFKDNQALTELLAEAREDVARLHDVLIGAEWHADEAARQRDVWKDRATTAERTRDEALSALREKEERVRVLEEALEPFVWLADSYFYRYETQPGVFRESHENDPDDRAVYGINRVEITTGDFRRARSVLTPVSREQRGEEA